MGKRGSLGREVRVSNETSDDRLQSLHHYHPARGHDDCSVRAGPRSGPQDLREPLRPLPWRRRQGRRDGAVDRRAPHHSRRSAAARADSRRYPRAWHAADRGQQRRGRRPGEIPARHRAAPESRPVRAETAPIADGKALEGVLLAEASTTCRCSATTAACPLRRMAPDFRESLRRSTAHLYGDPRGNTLHDDTQIDKTNVGRSAEVVLSPSPRGSSQATRSSWRGSLRVEPERCFALDAGTGRQICDITAESKGTGRSREPRRGGRGRPPVHGHRHAHLLARTVHRCAALGYTMEDWRKNYSATSAPLAVAGDMVTPASPAASTAPTVFLADARSAHRQGDLALLDRSDRASPVPRPGVARISSTAAPRRGSPAATIPSST